MSLKRPGFKPNLKANMASTKYDNLFVKIPVGSTMLFRFLHPCVEGPIWCYRAQHFNLKDAEDKGIAIADLSIHGTDETGKIDYINKLIDILINNFGGKKGPLKKVISNLTTSHTWNAQVLVAEKQEDKTFTYSKPKILGMPRSGANSTNKVEQAADMGGDPSPYDVDKGFNIMIEHTKESPWYAAQRAGQPVSLDEILPGWEEMYIQDMEAKCPLKVFTYEEQREAVMRTYADQLDWDVLQKEYDL